MDLVFEGIFFGLSLCFLLGPIFMALTQTSIEKGGTAGLLVGLGVWVSDALFIVGTYLFLQAISATLEDDSFKFWMGIVGGLIMIGFGFGSFFSKVDLSHQQTKHSYRNLIGYWLKGFLVNTINPFTFVFWIGTISVSVVGQSLSQQEATVFLGSILTTIIVTDVVKVALAKYLRTRLKEKHLKRFAQIAGTGLIILGIVLVFRVF